MEIDPSAANRLGQPPLLATKLRRPRVRASIVSRPRLTERLNGGLNRALTLISAPVGFGKTTLLGEWLAGAAQAVPATWISLDEDDNDPVRFLTYVVAALNDVQEGVGSAALTMLRSPLPPPTKAVLTSLLNDLASVPGDLILVLDDYHAISAPAVHDAVAFLLGNLPPQMHFVIATRSDPPLPLSRLRARDQLVEIRGPEFPFTLEEAETFLNRAMGLDLNAGDVAALQSSTEGWIAALQLIAVSLQERRDVASLVATVTGAHRYIVDYLVDEVLSRQPEEDRLFLLRTSILSDLGGPLCDAVCGRSDSAAVLVRLERANLFMTSLDEERHWYRYHHLFAECLRNRLEAEEPGSVPELHRRASQWYERHGLVDVAIGHVLSAQDFETAARLVEEHAPGLLGQGGIVALLNWANRLPEALVQGRPRLSVLVGWALALAGQPEASESYLQSAEGALAGVPQPDSQNLQGQIAAVRASIAAQRADALRTIEYARQALSRLPPSEAFMRSLAAFNLGNAYLLTGEVVPASAAFADAVNLSLATGSLHMVTLSSAYLARTQMLRGRLREAEQVCQRALDLVAQLSEAPARTVPTLGMLYAYLGHLRRELDDLDGAGRYLGQAVDLGEQSGYMEVLAATYWALAQLHRAQADVLAGLAMIERAIDTVEEQSLTVMRRLLLAERADLLVALARLADAENWAREHRVGEAVDFALLNERECLSLVRLRLARGEVDEAVKLLARLLGPAEAAGRFGAVIEILALQALALHESGKLTPALSSLERALVLAEPEGYVRTFADHGEPMATLLRQVAARGTAPRYVARLLTAIASPGRSAGEPAALREAASDRGSAMKQSGAEPLTAREVEVLRLLADGASNQRIADELTVSVGTVKAHISHILGKIGASNRTEAVARARKLGLLEQE
ncbi:MAG: LuxR C-terminal-related transcriptional regulator [Chloroflexota bacterium]|nr:LuxR C-terminal-related transcriptional regulator [Chloroflexota bacterium]